MRRRVDPRKKAARKVAHRQSIENSEAKTPAATTQILEDSAISVLAVPDLPEGRLSAHDIELLAAARELADGHAGGVLVLALGGIGDFASHGVDRVTYLDDPVFTAYAPEARVDVVCALIEKTDPKHILFCESGDGGDIGRRVAARIGERPAAHVIKFSEEYSTGKVHRTGSDGRLEIIFAIPRVLLIAEGSFDSSSDIRHEARRLAPVEYAGTAKLKCDGMLPVDLADMALKDCAFVLGGGNGISDWPSFHELARVLKGAIGGSRVACDAGHLERDRQIGASGHNLSARCYVAFGISGAVQHLQGIEKCERVVSVNVDSLCPMVNRSDLAIIADAEDVVKALLQLKREYSGRP